MFANQAWAANPGRSFQARSAAVRPQWRPAKLAGSSAGLGQAGFKTSVAMAALVPTTLAAMTAYVGFRLGKTDHGIPSVLGYIVGGVGALAAVSSILLALGIITSPILDKALKPAVPPGELI